MVGVLLFVVVSLVVLCCDDCFCGCVNSVGRMVLYGMVCFV